MKNAVLLFSVMQVLFFAKDLTAQISKIDSFIENSARNNQFSGSVLIAKNGRVIYEKIAGYADIDNKIVNSEKTAFSIASVGKIFTATLILKYVELGRLKLDESVKQHLPGINFSNIDKITIHQLLSHTSGLGNYMSHPVYQNLLNNNLQIDDIIPLIEEQSLVFDEPGLRHEYSNSGYIILGKILENSTGKKYEEILSEEILKPLIMTSTKFTVDRNNPQNIAIGYRKPNPEQGWESTLNIFPVPLSDGGIFITSRDLLAFDNALFSGKLLQNATLKLMTSKQSEGEQPGFGKIYYGYGLMIDNFENQIKSVGHNGGSPGYNAEYRHYFIDKETTYTLIILSNHERVIRPLFFQIQEMILDRRI